MTRDSRKCKLPAHLRISDGVEQEDCHRKKKACLLWRLWPAYFFGCPKYKKSDESKQWNTKNYYSRPKNTSQLRLNRKLLKSPVISGDSMLSVPLCQRTTDINRTGAWLPQCLKATPMPILYKSHTSSPTKSLTIGRKLCVGRKLWYHSCPKMRYIQFYMMNLWLVYGGWKCIKAKDDILPCQFAVVGLTRPGVQVPEGGTWCCDTWDRILTCGVSETMSLFCCSD